MASSPLGYKLAAFTKNRTNPAYIGARLGADRVAARLGCSLRHHVPTKPDDVEEQRGLLAAVLAEGVDAILLAPTHATALNDLLQRARSKGIPILCMVSQPEQFDCTCFVGSDDRALGFILYEALLGGGILLPLGVLLLRRRRTKAHDG